jgi:hypothetical protein
MMIRSEKELYLHELEGYMKEIKVVFTDETTGYVKSAKLDALITSGKIKAFLRSGGWVSIGSDPIREIKYNGKDRRRVSRE